MKFSGNFAKNSEVVRKNEKNFLNNILQKLYRNSTEKLRRNLRRNSEKDLGSFKAQSGIKKIRKILENIQSIKLFSYFFKNRSLIL